MDSEPQSERRNCPRIEHSAAIIYYYDDGPERIERAGETLDLSARGIGMVVPHGLATGTRLRVQLVLKTRAIRATARVVRAVPEDAEGETLRVGLELTLAGSDARCLNQFVEECRKGNPPKP